MAIPSSVFTVDFLLMWVFLVERKYCEHVVITSGIINWYPCQFIMFHEYADNILSKHLCLFADRPACTALYA